MVKLIVTFIAVLFVAHARGDLTILPINTVVMAGSDTVVLTCAATSVPASRIMWTEFATDDLGTVISDNRNILASHPNAARYTILGTDNVFNLQISNISLADGGRYLCQDIQGSPPAVFRGSADLIVLGSDTVCEEFHTITGSVIEGQYYSTECTIAYHSDSFKPNMTWTGPGTYDLHESVSDNEVWTITSFVANRGQEGGKFECVTSFQMPDIELLPEYATNVPDYTHVFTGITLIVNWPPQNMQAVPIKPVYNVGDTITCSADSKPASVYRWTNMRTQVANPAGAVFTITEDLEGFDQVLRCNAVVLLDGSLYTNNIFINTTVPAATTTPVSTTVATTTPPPADGSCKDLTGHWSSTNPNAHVCIEMDSKGNLLTLIRNGTDPYFVAGNGKTVFGDFKHVGFTGIWPPGLGFSLGGVGGFTGECHSCFGNEVILMSGLSRNKAEAPGCGESAGTHLTPLYVLTRYGPPCRDVNTTVYRPKAEHIKYFGIRPDKIMR